MILADNSGIPLSLWTKAAVVGTAGFAYKLDEVDSLGVVYKTYYISTYTARDFFFYLNKYTETFPFFWTWTHNNISICITLYYIVNIYR